MTNVKENVAKAAINNDTKPASTHQLVDGENIYDLPEEMEMDEKVPPQRYSVDYSTDFPTLGANTCQESEHFSRERSFGTTQYTANLNLQQYNTNNRNINTNKYTKRKDISKRQSESYRTEIKRTINLQINSDWTKENT